MIECKEIEKIKYLRKVTFVMVEESQNRVECTKNRYGYRTINSCKDIDFEKVKLSEIEDNALYIQNRYSGKNIWLLLDK